MLYEVITESEVVYLRHIIESARGLTGAGREPDDVQECPGDLERAAEHCAQLTRSLLTFV